MSYKVTKGPKRSEKQEAAAKTHTRNLYEFFFFLKIDLVVIDDETEINAVYNQFHGRKFYMADKEVNFDDNYITSSGRCFGRK